MLSARAIRTFFVTFLAAFAIAAPATACSTSADYQGNWLTEAQNKRHLHIKPKTFLVVKNLDLPPLTRVTGSGTVCVAEDALYGFRIPGRTGATGPDRGSSEVMIEGIRIQQVATGRNVTGNRCDIMIEDGARDVRIRNVTFVDTRGDSAICGPLTPPNGTVTDKADLIQIEGNHFFGYNTVMYLENMSNFTVRGNFIRKARGEGIKMRENAGYGIITANQFINMDGRSTQPKSRDAIDTYWSGQKLVITDNIVRRTSNYGFDIKGISGDGQQGSRSVIIANNHISETGASAIHITGFGGIQTASGEVDFSETPNHSILVDGNIIERGNWIQPTDHSQAGIRIVGGNIRHINIVNNIITFHKGHGIYASVRKTPGLQNDISFIRVHGNTVLNGGMPSARYLGHGIFMQGVEAMMITDNTVGFDPALEPESLSAENAPGVLFYGAGIQVSPLGAPANRHIIDRNMILCTKHNAIGFTDDSGGTIEWTTGHSHMWPGKC